MKETELTLETYDPCLQTKRALVICNNRELLPQITTVLMSFCIDVTVLRTFHLLDDLDYRKIDVLILDTSNFNFLSSPSILQSHIHGSIPILNIVTATKLSKSLNELNKCDDFLLYPFEGSELIIRVQKLLRSNHSQFAQKNILEFKDLTIDLNQYRLYRNEEEIFLRPKEFSILCCLFEAKGRAVTRDEILNRVWGMEYFGSSNIVDVHIKSLRKKIEVDPKNPKYIKTVRGIGYLLKSS